MAVGSIASYIAHSSTGLISNDNLSVATTLTYDGSLDDSADVAVQPGNQAFRILSSGRYLIITKVGWNGADLGNNNRTVVRTDVQIGGVSLSSITGRASCFLRDAGAADEGHHVTVSYVDHAVTGGAGDDISVDVQNFGDTSVSLADQIASASSIQVVRLDDGADWLQVTRTTDTAVTGGAGGGSTTIRPADSDFATISWENQVVETDSAVIEWVSGTDVTCRVAGWYLVLVNQFTATTGSNRQSVVTKIMVNDANVNGQSHLVNYSRDTDGSEEAWGMIPMLLNLSANDVITVDEVRDGETATNDISSLEAALTVIQLPSSVDVVSTYHDVSRAGETLGVFPMDAENSDPNGQHDLVSNTGRINGTADANDWLFLAGFQSTTTISDTSRVTEHFRFSRTGVLESLGDFLAYHRGDQGLNGVFTSGRHGAIALESFGAAEWVAIDLRQESGTGNQNRDFIASRVGLQGLDLSTLSGAGSISLIVQEATLSQVAEVPVLTQSSTLSVAESLHSVFVDTTVLTQRNTLVVSSSDQQLAVDLLTLSQSHTLSVAEALQSILIEDVSLSQSNTLVVAECLQAILGENIDLTQANTLALADALLSIVVDNISLTQSVSLVIAEALQSISIDNVALAQANVLAVDETLQVVSADSPVLTQANVLAVAQSLQSIVVDNVILSQSASLVIAEALLSVTIDGLSLTQANVLVLSDALHSLAVDNVALSQSTNLIINETLQGISVDSPILAQAHILSISEALQSISAGNVVLTTASTLSVAETVQAISADNITLSTSAILAVLDTLQSVSVDTPSITQAITIAVSDTIQVIACDSVVLSQSTQLAVAETLQALTVDGVSLSQSSVLAIAVAVQAVTAASIDLSQSSTLIVSNALMAFLADQVPLSFGALTRDTYVVIKGRNRITIVSKRSRHFLSSIKR
jgi:hypothetical protein